jgi:hypothetical protein
MIFSGYSLARAEGFSYSLDVRLWTPIDKQISIVVEKNIIFIFSWLQSMNPDPKHRSTELFEEESGVLYTRHEYSRYQKKGNVSCSYTQRLP